MTSIRVVVPAGAPTIAATYAHNVLTDTATLHTEPPLVASWVDKIETLAKRNCTFLVAQNDGQVTSYAYATQFRDRPACARTCESSVYLCADCQELGMGSALMTALCDAAVTSGFHEMIAVAGGGKPASVRLHRKAGFHHAGRLELVGAKLGRRLDTVYMQRTLAPR